jgi:hypothetical protein
MLSGCLLGCRHPDSLWVILLWKDSDKPQWASFPANTPTMQAKAGGGRRAANTWWEGILSWELGETTGMPNSNQNIPGRFSGMTCTNTAHHTRPLPQGTLHCLQSFSSSWIPEILKELTTSDRKWPICQHPFGSPQSHLLKEEVWGLNRIHQNNQDDCRWISYSLLAKWNNMWSVNLRRLGGTCLSVCPVVH